MKVPRLSELPENLNVVEVASFLRCTRAHVYKLLAGKVAGVPRLECIRVGRRIIVRKAALLDWLTRAEKATTQTCYDPRTPGIDAVAFQ